ncbi:GGDEF domain-containing protein [Acinetobacter sp. ANC 4805]|uniref:GGDEF domain-containing protein n=1 Tax=Acinetobacter sp. ANC 4805 TaxID=2923425 RepID=UPI001F4B09B6|nr:GGDEF domain-containing protein [Acinetobacter sp. ANC 4805]MCH7311345.1 GGDEF domain-containing protein [Acinetobacter sp. ANC 4805]
MKPTDQTLMKQMHISIEEIEYRRSLLTLTHQELQQLVTLGELLDLEYVIDQVVIRFYQQQTSISEIAILIGDIDTLSRLQRAQRQYLVDLFSGNYDANYVNNRLRIGLVHKRIGVELKLYLSAVYHLKAMLILMIQQQLGDTVDFRQICATLEKLFMFDMSLVVETYVWSLVSELKTSKDKIEQYASVLEDRAQQMEALSQTDPLTGLLNVRHLDRILSSIIDTAERSLEPVTVVFIDINDFKMINDNFGHSKGDQILKVVADAIRYVARLDDHCFRCGGDEFCIVFPRCTEEQATESFVPRLLQYVYQIEPNITLSIGVKQTDHVDGYLDASRLVHEADAKMYLAKKEQKIKK